MTSLGTLDLNFLTLRRLFPYRSGTTDICANTILLQNPQGEPIWIDPASVFADVSGTLVAKGSCMNDYLYWNTSSQLWLAGGLSSIHIGCDSGSVLQDVSALAIGIQAGQNQQGRTAVALGYQTGALKQGVGAVGAGFYAGYSSQGAGAVAVGSNAGLSGQGVGSIAIGSGAGSVQQDSSAVAIGFNAGLNIQGTGAVAMGAYAGYMDQSGSAVAIGLLAGNAEQGFGGVAMGAGAGLACQTMNAVAVGYYAGSGNQGKNAVAIGESAGASLQGIGAVAIGSLAGYSTQGAKAIAIGSNAGAITQGEGAVAVGYLAGSNAQLNGAIAIGSNAGYNSQNFNAVAMGIGAGYSSQGIGSIAIGLNAGYSTQNAGAVAIGMAAGFSTQGVKAVAIGSNAGFVSQSAGAVAIGAGAGYSTQNAGAVAIGSNAGFSTQGAGAVAIGLSAGWSSQGADAVAIGLNAGLSTQGAGAVAMGSSAGATDQSANAVAIGLSAGFSTQGTSAVAIGWTAGSNVQGTGAIAVGEGAGLTRQGTNAVAVGLGAGLSTQNANAIAIGSNAGYSTQGLNAIAFGQAAGVSLQSANAIAIGSNAGANVQKVGAIAMGARAGWSTQGAGAVAIGSNAGVMDQRANAIAIGLSAGWSTQGTGAIAIGSNAGYSSQGSYAVAIGGGAGWSTQGIDAIAIGSNAGATNQGRGGIAIGAIKTGHIQGVGAIAIGSNAFTTTQGTNAIAIGNTVCGANAQGANAIAIGNSAVITGQVANSIILNATTTGINATQQTLYLDPVRDYSSGTDPTVLLQYVTGDKSVVYNNNVTINSAAGTINVSGDILPTADITYSLGSSALAFKHLYVSSIISDGSNVAISGDIIPYADNVYSVGLSTMRWKDVFVGPGSIYIGGSTNMTRAILDASGDALLINSRNTGNVGIGTNNPSTYKLRVEGETFLNATVTSGGNIVPSTADAYNLGSSAVRWDNIYTNYIDVSAGFTFTGNLNPSTDNTYSLGINTTRWKDLYIGTGAVYIGGAIDASRAILESSGNSLIINKTNGGFVGIGTSNPYTTLDVSGETRAKTMSINADTDATQSGLYFNVANAAKFVLVRPANTTDLTFLNNNTGFAGYYQLTLKSNRNVGIGSSNPTQALDVSGIARVTATASYGTMQLQSSGTNENGLFIKDPGQTGNNGWLVGSSVSFFGSDSSGFLIGRFTAGNAVPTRGIYILPSGNVGIGTTDPGSYKLSIIGSLNIGGVGSLGYQNIRLNGGNSYGYIYTQYPILGDGIHMGFNFYADTSGDKIIHNPLYQTSRITCDFGNVRFYTGGVNTEPSQRMMIDITGNVGIGTNNPGYKLDVNGDIRAQGAVYGEFNAVFDPQIIARGTGANINKFAYMGYNTLNNFGYIGAIESGIAQRDLHIQKDGGNVRIGSTVAPAYKLDVNGDVNIVAGSSYRIGGTAVLTPTNYVFAAGTAYCDTSVSPYVYVLQRGYNISSVDWVGNGRCQFNFTNYYVPGDPSSLTEVYYTIICTANGDGTYFYSYTSTRRNGYVVTCTNEITGGPSNLAAVSMVVYYGG